MSRKIWSGQKQYLSVSFTNFFREPWKLDWDKFLVPGMLVALVIGLTFLNDHFLTLGNLLNVLQQISILAIVSAGMTFVIIGGGFDLSVGAVIALTGSLAALVMVRYGMVLGIGVGLLAGMATGMINGLFVSLLKVNPFITTLGMSVVARGVALGITGGTAILNLPSSFSWLGNGRIFGVPVSGLVVIVVYIIGLIVLRRTTVGLKIYAVGGNKEAARLSGMKANKISLATYIISGFTAGLAGILMAARLRSGDPTSGMTMELFSVAAVVLGGTSLKGGEGYLSRSLIGVLFIGFLENGLNLLNVPYYWQQVVIGSLFMLTAALGMIRSRKSI